MAGETVEQEQRCDLCNKIIKIVKLKVPEVGAAEWLDKFQPQTFDTLCMQCEQDEDEGR
jgi:hypothetical protein